MTKEADNDIEQAQGDVVPGGIPKAGEVQSESERLHALAKSSGWVINACSGWMLTCLIVLVGSGVACAFLVLGIRDEVESTELFFQQSATDVVNSIRSSWLQYEIFCLWAHESCHKLKASVDSNSTDLFEILHMCSREEFRNVYEQILSSGLGIYALQYAPKVGHRYREAVQESTRSWLVKQNSTIEYEGFYATEWSAEGPTRVPVRDKPVYFPLHLVEPLEGNENIIDYDVYTYERDQNILDMAFEDLKPSLSTPIRLVQETNPHIRGVFLTHPGAPSSVFGESPHSIAGLVVRIPDLLNWAIKHSTIESKGVYLYDSTDGNMEYLGRASAQRGVLGTTLDEIAYEDVPTRKRTNIFERTIDVVDRKWTVVVVPLEKNERGSLTFVVLGGGIIFFFFSLLAILLRWHLARIDAFNTIKTEAEKTASAEQQVLRERRINEYMAHEVRNPLASAMAAVSFVTDHTMDRVKDEETRSLLLEDTRVIDSSLSYIDDLLRSMLDVNRAKTGQIKMNETPTDILKDILEPAAAILCIRGVRVQVLTECPQDLVVLADQLRLKQVILNLCINATKFVEQGFIRLRASLVDERVVLSVEDSGPGVPLEKRDRLFECFQESFDLLNQGTGIGLSICSNLCLLISADIRLDRTFQTGIPGCPGARFVVDLQRAPIKDFGQSWKFETTDTVRNEPIKKGDKSDATEPSMESSERDHQEVPRRAESTVTEVSASSVDAADLPQSMEVLFVDDETILRRLFIRTVQRVAPTWAVTEAGNGERALQLAQERNFDIIFIDQFMPCIERPLLGTEVVRRLRVLGVSSLICGLSANDLREDFLQAGANDFIHKPFPCKKDLLTRALKKLCDDPFKMPEASSDVSLEPGTEP